MAFEMKEYVGFEVSKEDVKRTAKQAKPKKQTTPTIKKQTTKK